MIQFIITDAVEKWRIEIIHFSTALFSSCPIHILKFKFPIHDSFYIDI